MISMLILSLMSELGIAIFQQCPFFGRSQSQPLYFVWVPFCVWLRWLLAL